MVAWCLGSLRAAGGIVDASPAYQKNLAQEVTILQRLYGGGDLNQFPNFKFTGRFQGFLLCDGKTDKKLFLKDQKFEILSRGEEMYGDELVSKVAACHTRAQITDYLPANETF